MTEHGFGRVQVDTISGGGSPNPGDVRKIAKEVSKTAGVKQAHTLKAKSSGKDNQIMFEYGHISTDFKEEYPDGHTDFDDAILGITYPDKNPRVKLINLEKWTFDKDVP